MSGIKHSVVLAAGLASLVLLVGPSQADAAVLKRNLNCATIYLVLTTPLGGTTNSSSVVMKNTGSSAIPAGTIYSYTIPAGSFEYRNPAALGSGAVLSLLDARVTSSGACTASVPGVVVKNRLDALPLNNITLAPN
jgi:hypothetical protein